MKIFVVVLICLLPLNTVVSAGGQDHKIDLEDIERDNILSERRAQGKDTLQVQQTQHIRPPGIQSHSQFIKHDRPSGPSSSGPLSLVVPTAVTYVTKPPESHYESFVHIQQPTPIYTTEDDSSRQGHGQSIQYVTYRPETYQTASSVAYPPAPAVHESSRTYTVPSRQSLVQPITTKVAPFLQQQQQPRYVYVQAKSQPQQQSQPQQKPDSRTNNSPASGIQYAALSPQTEGAHYAYATAAEQHQEQQEQEQDRNNQIEQETYSQPGSHQPQPQFLQYVPYIAAGPSHGHAYVMMVPIPAGYTQVPKHVTLGPGQPILTYAHPSVVSTVAPVAPVSTVAGPVVGPPPSHQQLIQYVTPSITAHHPGIHYISSNEIQSPPENVERHVQPKQEQVRSQVEVDIEAQDIRYVGPSQQVSPAYTQSRQFQYAPEHPDQRQRAAFHEQQKIHQYLATQTLTPQQQTHYATSHHNQPLRPLQLSPQTLDFYGAYNTKHKSLFESYIPSWTILKSQQALLASQKQQQPHNYASSAPVYNTIAYSSPQATVQPYLSNHLKRSTPNPKP